MWVRSNSIDKAVSVLHQRKMKMCYASEEVIVMVLMDLVVVVAAVLTTGSVVAEAVSSVHIRYSSNNSCFIHVVPHPFSSVVLMTSCPDHQTMATWRG